MEVSVLILVDQIARIQPTVSYLFLGQVLVVPVEREHSRSFQPKNSCLSCHNDSPPVAIVRINYLGLPAWQWLAECIGPSLADSRPARHAKGFGHFPNRLQGVTVRLIPFFGKVCGDRRTAHQDRLY